MCICNTENPKNTEEVRWYQKTENGQATLVCWKKDCPNDILTNKEKKQLINLISDTSFNDDEFKNFWNTFISRCISKQKRALGQNK